MTTFQTGLDKNEEVSKLLRKNLLQENRFGNLSVTNASAQGKSMTRINNSLQMSREFNYFVYEFSFILQYLKKLQNIKIMKHQDNKNLCQSLL